MRRSDNFVIRSALRCKGHPMVDQARPRKPDDAGDWNPAAAAAAWLVPGLGHWMIGLKTRAKIIGGGIMLLWLLGVLIGGADAVNVDRNKYWFIPQAVMAPNVALQAAHHFHILGEKPQPWEEPQSGIAYEPAFGRPLEQGVLFTALAGFLNLLAVIDVIFRDADAPAADHAANRQPAGARP